jgi:hypothetical protein
MHYLKIKGIKAHSETDSVKSTIQIRYGLKIHYLKYEGLKAHLEENSDKSTM